MFLETKNKISKDEKKKKKLQISGTSKSTYKNGICVTKSKTQSKVLLRTMAQHFEKDIVPCAILRDEVM